MKKWLFLLVIALSALAEQASAQNIPVYNADQLVARFSGKDTVYIINCWATWCIPCVKELPQFDSLQDFYQGKPVKIILASFDFKDTYPEKLQQFVSRKKMKPEVVWFSETNANEFIPKIEDKWSGALPATLIIDNIHHTRRFIEDSITADEIKGIVGSAF